MLARVQPAEKSMRLRESDLTVGKDVLVINPEHQRYDQLGQIWKINKYVVPAKVLVCFEGEIYSFRIDDLCLA